MNSFALNALSMYLLTDLWKAVKSTPIRECSINKRSGWYSENPRYRDPLLTYKQMIAVFKGLLRIGFIEVTQEGYYDRVKLQGGLTRFVARDELLERLLGVRRTPCYLHQA